MLITKLNAKCKPPTLEFRIVLNARHLIMEKSSPYFYLLVWAPSKIKSLLFLVNAHNRIS